MVWTCFKYRQKIKIEEQAYRSVFTGDIGATLEEKWVPAKKTKRLAKTGTEETM